ncbi:MAG: hypothetical protein WDN06_18810 [Asticcacaulis sp.]
MDKDPDTGDWVYKAIDRYTGEVVRQLPRQDLLGNEAKRLLSRRFDYKNKSLGLRPGPESDLSTVHL